MPRISELTDGGGASLGDQAAVVRSAASRRARVNFARLTNIAAMTALTGMSDNDTVEVLGYTSEGDGGGGTFFWDASSTQTVVRGMIVAADAGGTGRWTRVYAQPISAAWFGLAADGTTDDTAGLSAFASWMSANGGTGVIPPGAYMNSTTLDFNMSATALGGGPQRTQILGYGAEILNNAAVYAVTLRNTGQMRPCVIQGFTVNHRNNNTALGGFLLESANHAVVRDAYVQANTSLSTYRAYHIRWTTDTSANTGTYWAHFDNCNTRELAGADPNNIPVGLRIEDNVNALRVTNCDFLSCATCIELVPNSDSSAYVNGLLVMGCAFEGYTTAIEATAAGTISGARFIGNRFENGTTVFDFDAFDSSAAVPPLIFGNYYISNSGTIISNANSIEINFQDFGETPSLPAARWSNDDGYEFRTTSSGDEVTMIPAGGTGAGFAIYDNGAASKRVWMRWTGGSNGTVGALGNMVYNVANTTVRLESGSGSPEGVLAASPGSLYLRTDGSTGTSLYVKETGTGNTGWVAK